MIRYENECVGCPSGIGCFGSSCPNRKVPHYYCDKCHREEVIYDFDNEELCIDCIEKKLDKVEA